MKKFAVLTCIALALLTRAVVHADGRLLTDEQITTALVKAEKAKPLRLTEALNLNASGFVVFIYSPEGWLQQLARDAKREMRPWMEHCLHRYLNNCAENSATHASAGETHARVQITRARPTLPRRLWSHHAALPTPTSPLACVGLPSRDAATLSHLAGTDERTDRSIRAATREIMHLWARKSC